MNIWDIGKLMKHTPDKYKWPYYKSEISSINEAVKLYYNGILESSSVSEVLIQMTD